MRCDLQMPCNRVLIPKSNSPEMKYTDTNGIAAFVGLWFVL